MAVPQRHEEFNDTYDYDYATRSGWTQNAKVHRGAPVENVPANENYRPVTRYANNSRARYEQNTPANENAAPTGARVGRNNPPPVAAKGLDVAKILPTSVWVFSWANFIWMVVQVPAAFVSIIMFGAAYQASQSWWYDTAAKLLHMVGYGLGFQSADIINLFYAAAGICFIGGAVNLAFGWFTYTLAGAKPLFGETGTAAKQSSFLLVLIMSFIPGLNFLPWIWLWIAAVTYFPK